MAKKATLTTAKPHPGIETWVCDLTRQFIKDGVHQNSTFTAERQKGQWGICAEYLWEDTRRGETRTGHWFITYSGVQDEAGVREVVRRVDELT